MRRAAPPVKGDWFRFDRNPRNAVTGEPEGDTTAVYIYDEIGMWGTTAEDFVQQLMQIKTKKIDLHLNTPGGEVFDGLAIFNSLKQHSAEVTTYVDSLAASAGSFIAMAGEKVIMARNATLMIHDASAMQWGNADEMREMAKLLDGFSDNIADIYARKTGADVSEMRGLMKAETWYTAKEALDAGFADEMTDPDDEVEEAEKPENKWDLSLFNHAGRDHAESPFRVRERVRLMNKENAMGNSPTNTGTPEATPAEQSGQTDPGEHEAEDAGAGSPDTDENANTTEGSETETGANPNPPEAVPSNKLVVTNIGGQQYQVPAAVASRLTALETFQTETVEAHRTAFVNGLAASNRISATDIGKTIAWAIDLSDDSYDTWATMMGSAPASALFAQHGQHNPGDESANAVNANAAEIATLEDIVASHRRAGMSKEVLETKDSWKRLQQLNTENN